ncbi:MAG: hypothetical protein ACRDV4_10300 [Acidimicrobiales bacterium]
MAVLAGLAPSVGTFAQAATTHWTPAVANPNSGRAKGGTLGEPTITQTRCPAATKRHVTVTWTTVANASSYTVLYSYDSTGYATLAAGVTSTTYTNTTTNAPAGTYSFEIKSVVGNYWSATSSPNTPTTNIEISTSSPKCRRV